jgi:hypothetical protein
MFCGFAEYVTRKSTESYSFWSVGLRSTWRKMRTTDSSTGFQCRGDSSRCTFLTAGASVEGTPHEIWIEESENEKGEND